MSKPLLIEQINNSTDTQGRAGIDEDHVADLRTAWEEKKEIPALLVFFDGTEYWLADGFHRLAAAVLAKRASVPCDIQKGTKREAWLASLAANRIHGLRRTHADKRRVVTLALNDDELVKWSDGRIADHVGVSQNFVGEIRAQLKSNLSSPDAKTALEPKIGLDGKARKPPKKSEPSVDFGTRSKPTEPAKQATKAISKPAVALPEPEPAEETDSQTILSAAMDHARQILSDLTENFPSDHRAILGNLLVSTGEQLMEARAA